MASDYKAVWQRPVTTGLVLNVPTTALPVGGWLVAKNVACRDGSLVKAPGWTKRLLSEDERGDGEVVSLIQPCRFSADSEINLVATDKHFYRVTELGLTRITETPFAMPATERWRADYLLGAWYLTNPVDGLWKLLATGAPTLVDTNGFKGRQITTFRNHLILSNLASEDSQSEHQWAGSGLADESPPLGWDTTVEGSDALLRDIPEHGSAIMAARRWGDYLVHYKENTLHATAYIGGDNVYQTELRAENGLLAPDALSAWRDRHYFVGRDNLYVFAGGMPEPIGDRVWRWWVPRVKNRPSMYCVPYPRQKEWWILYQDADAPGISHALVCDYYHGGFTMRDLPFSWMGYIKGNLEPTYDELNVPMDSLDVPFVGSYNPEDYDLVGVGADGSLYTLGERAIGAAGEPVESVLETGDFVAPDGGFMTCGGLMLSVPALRADSGEAELEVYTAGRMSEDEPVNWRGPYRYRGGGVLKFLVSGRLIRFKFRHCQLGEFVLSGYAPLMTVRT